RVRFSSHRVPTRNIPTIPDAGPGARNLSPRPRGRPELRIGTKDRSPAARSVLETNKGHGTKSSGTAKRRELWPDIRRYLSLRCFRSSSLAADWVAKQVRWVQIQAPLF